MGAMVSPWPKLRDIYDEERYLKDIHFQAPNISRSLSQFGMIPLT